MTDIKIKKQRYADKENLKKLMKYSKGIFANKTEINEKFYTKEQIDTMLESGSGGGGTSGDYYTKSEIDTKLNLKANTSDLSNYYTKTEVDNLLSNIGGGTGSVSATNAELDELTTEWSFE